MHVQKHSTQTLYSGLSLSLSISLWRTTWCTETLDTDNIFGSLSLSLWRTTCMYRNTRYWQNIRASPSLVMTYNMQVQKNSSQTLYSGLSLSLSGYDVQQACTETLDTDNIFVSLSHSLWRTICMYRNTRYWQYFRASLSLSRYDVQHACTETLDTDNIFGPLSLSLWRRTCMYSNTRYWEYIPVCLSLVMTYNMHVQKHSTQTLYSGLTLSLSLVMT